MPRSHLLVENFSPRAPALRRHFEQRFADPRQADGGRFVWDYWHVPDQYSLLRTPAYHYFPKAMYEAFHNDLVQWGRRNLGCHDISPPWLSCYVDGCRQELHGDMPHGPWAFVLSLTPSAARFTGGQTQLLRPEVLRFWENYREGEPCESKRLWTQIAPRFNRLIVFDPRVPHGVTPVHGSRDPREGRLVIHGWFVQPRPFVQGPLPTKALGAFVRAFEGELRRRLAEPLLGTLSVRFKVSGSGRVSSLVLLTDTLQTRGPASSSRRLPLRVLREILGSYEFPKSRGASLVTLPVIFSD